MATDIQVKYKFEARDWQKKCLNSLKRFTVLAVHRRAGKTTISINVLILTAIKHPDRLYAYIAPELKQAKLIAWKALKDACQQFQNVQQGKKTVNLCEFRESELTIRFWNGSEIRLFGADNPDSLRGSKLAGVVVDEVAQMPKELWQEIVYPALMDSKGFALFIGTPKGINLFSELFDKGQDPVFKDSWVSLKFTCYETDALDPEDIELYKKSVPDEVFKREMLCDFSASGANQLISLFDAQQATKRDLDPTYVSRMPLIMGVDVARFGDDSSTIMFRQGLICYEPITCKGLDLVLLSEVILRHVAERQPRAIFIDGTGVGGGLVDILNNKIHFVSSRCLIFDINFGRKSAFAQYNNMRTQMWDTMKKWLQQGGAIPNDDELVSDLAMPTYDVNDKGQMILESKKQIRDRLGRSPDKGDALALTFAEEIDQTDYIDDPIKMAFRERQNSIAQYANNANPFDRFERERSNSWSYTW